jgi:hypothetical protein
MRASVTATFLAIVTLSCRSVVDPSLTEHTSSWPNEPAGLAALTDQPWTALTSGDWNRRESSEDHIVADQTAPLSPMIVLEYFYPSGFEGGRAPATHYYPLNRRKDLFVGLEWKVSDPWQGHSSGVNKIQFIYAADADVAMVMYGPKGGPYELRVMPQWPEHGGSWLTPNVANPAVTVGRWHRIEWYLSYESRYGAGDGIIRWWLDGVLVGNYNNVRYPDDAGFAEYQISPTWGGIGDVKTETDYYRFNHSYISSSPNTASSLMDVASSLMHAARSRVHAASSLVHAARSIHQD